MFENTNKQKLTMFQPINMLNQTNISNNFLCLKHIKPKWQLKSRKKSLRNYAKILEPDWIIYQKSLKYIETA